eukprot:TRINITY_DN17877_c0_g1_i1.p1 TRINITY_DN17877_c0_g1~~TRINITY_DN17877_c0_g1_i1.p1  ORF type:complete len:710 (+),score=111.14 TRINITY_DN17877_c0_g1_i1:127-2256(+)
MAEKTLTGASNQKLAKGAAQQLRTRLERCIALVQAQSVDFKPRRYLLPTLEDTLKLVNLGATDALSNKAVIDALGLENPRSQLLQAVNDAVNACLLVLTLIESNNQETSSALMTPDQIFLPFALLRGFQRRLRALRPLLQAEVLPSQADSPPPGSDPDAGTDIRDRRGSLVDVDAMSIAEAAANWDPSTLLLSESLASFWRHYFPGRAAVPSAEFLTAIEMEYEPLTSSERTELLSWLQTTHSGQVAIVDVALVLDGTGLWRSILFCTSWPELLPQDVLPTIRAGGVARHIEMTAADIAAEKRQKQRSFLLPEWTRERLRADRSALHALRTLGVQVVANVGTSSGGGGAGEGGSTGGGMLVLCPFARVAQKFTSSSSSIRRVCRELIGGTGLAAAPVQNISLARCVGNTISARFDIQEPRSQHITLSRLHRRKSFELRDDALDALGLQQQRRDSLRDHLVTSDWGKSAVSADPAPRACLPLFVAAPNGRDDDGNAAGRRELLFRISGVQEERQHWTRLRWEAAMRWNAEGNADEPKELQLEHLGADLKLESFDEIVQAEANMCVGNLTRTSRDMSAMEQTLATLEQTFDRLRKELIKRGKELDQRIGETEEHLVTLSWELAQRREAMRTAANNSLDARLVLAELMMVPTPLLTSSPLGKPPSSTTSSVQPAIDALEIQLTKETEALKARAEELEKQLRKSRAALAAQKR